MAQAIGLTVLPLIGGASKTPSGKLKDKPEVLISTWCVRVDQSQKNQDPAAAIVGIG